MAPAKPLSHEQLLTLARKTAAAAGDGDRDRLRAAGHRLSDALADHLDAERAELEGLAGEQADALLRGQGRVVELLDELLAATGTSGSRCWEPLAQELVAHLVIQASKERRQIRAVDVAA